MDKKAILFDMDGVVINSMPYHVKAWKKAFKEHDLDVDERLFFLYEGAIEPDIACKLFNKNGTQITENLFYNILERQKEIFLSEFTHLIKPFNKIPEILESLKGLNFKLALVTSSHEDILQQVLPKELKLLFDHIVTGDQVKRRKPHPDPYLAGLKGLNISPSQAFCAIENAPAGIKSAKNAGLNCVAITTTLSPEELSEADEIIESHEKLLDYIQG